MLTFDQSITAIVGPNGSGKSNLSDAVRWVMGEQSTRALRGGRMEDVIFGGTAKRRQTGYAQVSLVLDNSDHRLPREENEIMVTRRYYRSGESEYYINRDAVRLKDLSELFMDTGLGREGYAIIGQGRIDEILSQRSTDRREVFEEAAGISRFRHRKEEAQRKLERTDENLLRVNDKVDELELQLEPLRVQRDKAKKYLTLRDELRGLEIAVWLDSLEHIRAGVIQLETDLQSTTAQRDGAKTAQEAAYADAEDCARQMQEHDVAADGLRRQEQQRQEQAGALESAVAVLNSSIAHNDESARRIRADLQQQEGREDSLAAQIAQRKDRLEEIEGQLSAGSQAIQVQREKVEENAKSSGQLEQELERLRDSQALAQADAADARALRSALAAAAQEVLDRDGAVRRELAELEEQSANAEAQLAQAQREQDEAKQSLDQGRNAAQGYALLEEKRRKKAESCKDAHMKAQMEENALAARIRLLSDMERQREGFSRAVKLVMDQADRGILKGVHGPVAGLVKAPDRVALAIETALGGAMQNIVVDREEDGKAVIQFLKRREGGRATILPIATIRPHTLREGEALSRQPGFVGVADRLVSFDRRYQNIFSNLLGRVAVMEDLDHAIAAARKFGYQFRIVTLDGQMLNPGGSMTGGSAVKGAGILSRANELEQLEGRRAELAEHTAQWARQLADAQREATAAAYQRQTAQEQLREFENAILLTQGRIQRAQGEKTDLERRQAALRGELEQLQARSAKIDADAKAAQARLTQLEGAAQDSQSAQVQQDRRRSDLKTQAEALTAELSRLTAAQAALEAEREATQAGLRELEALRESLAGDRAQSQSLVAEYETKNQGFSKEIQEKQNALSALREESRQCAQQLEGLNAARLELEARRVRATRESQTRSDELLRLEAEVSRLSQKKSAAAMEEKQLLDKLWETYGLSHEAARRQRQELDSVPAANRRIGELKRAISALGQVNVGAVEEFDRVNQRYTYLTGQRDDVERARRELERIISGLTGEMKAIFQREFALIDQAFGQTFVELFGGGKARLELEDPDDVLNCGIDIKVQPPGKALKTITLLSGGEKAFVAIALYFAILKVRPTPFVVMDEIEAALDDNNVARFAQYMRAMADKTQFIVITHRRGTMEEADALYGVTMQEQGVSRMLSLNLNEMERELNLRERP